ncbi:hypothetical protein CPB86DRAFT_158045 [Serendipita vermifera]|nr:hypothetical protein CPB86DRAFT_158045 [Serendipita vermifera]
MGHLHVVRCCWLDHRYPFFIGPFYGPNRILYLLYLFGVLVLPKDRTVWTFRAQYIPRLVGAGRIPRSQRFLSFPWPWRCTWHQRKERALGSLCMLGLMASHLFSSDDC